MSRDSSTSRPADADLARPPAGRMMIVAIVYVAVVVAAAVYPLVSPLRDYLEAPVSPLAQAVHVLEAVLWLAVLLASMARQRHGRLWKLIFAFVVAQRAFVLGYVPASLSLSIEAIAGGLAIAVFVHLLLAYPSGYLRDRFDRAVVGIAYGLAFAWSLMQLLVSPARAVACGSQCLISSIVIWPDPDLYSSLRGGITIAASLVVFPLVLAGLWRHWRDAGTVARRGLLPVVVAVPILLGFGAVAIVSREFDGAAGRDLLESRSGEVIELLVPVILPLGLLIGILRTRWSRGRIADLVVDLGRGVPIGGLRDILARTLGDPSLELAFASPSGAGFVDADGRPVALPEAGGSRRITRLERDGELLGVLVHDPAVEAEDSGLVEAVGNAARLALENERLAAQVRAQLEEVRASRIRIVEAGDAERRRVERDLHDGAQQRLVALTMRLQLARVTTSESSALLDETTAELEIAIGEVRDLARGVHPTILTEAGLAAAVDALAERTPIEVSVDVPDRRYPSQVEATAYFVVAEALTNVARHASATEARLVVAEQGARSGAPWQLGVRGDVGPPCVPTCRS